MLKFNSYRSDRYLRSRFLEGRLFLANEASDLELEMIDHLRKATQTLIGDVAIEDAWLVTRLSATQLLIAPGEAWFKGLPFAMRSGKDQLVSGASLVLGLVPPGVSVTDSATGTGKILTFTNTTTPTNNFKIVINATEEVITNVQDPFLKNINIPEATGEKLRLKFQINIVPVSTQTSTPIPYVGDATGDYLTANLVNEIFITPGVGVNGQLISSGAATGSEAIDGRNIELTIRNDPGLGGVKIPTGATDQNQFANGKFVDSVGSTFHINAIFNDTVSTQVIIRLDKEVGQPDPVITNGIAYSIIKKDVYATDDTNGNPTGKLFWPIANVAWNTTNGFVHNSAVTDLRDRVISKEAFEDALNSRVNTQATGGGVIDVDSDGETLTWTGPFALINPAGPAQTIAAGSAVLLDGGTLTYELDYTGGAIEVGNLAVTVASNLANVATLSGGPDLTLVKVGNVVKLGIESTFITAIDNVAKTITLDTAFTTTGSATIYRDSFAEGTVPLKENLYVLAIRSGSKIRVIDDLELSAGESNAIYDVRLQYPSGLATNTNITLPNNSITGKAQYFYSARRNLEVYHNQLMKFQGVDWIAIDTSTIQFNYALSNDSEVHFRIDSLPAGSVGGGGSGGSGDLQGAYNGGNTIAVTTGLPVTLSGTGKLLHVAGSVQIDGLIDPTGIEFIPQVSSPITATKQGLWVNTSNELMFDDGTTDANITQQIADLESGVSNPITAGDGLTKTLNDLSVNVDDTTIEIVTDTLQVKDDAIDEFKLNSSVAGAGLSGGSGLPLEVGAGAGIQVNTDDIEVLYAPATKITAIAGQAMAANTAWLVRWALSGETANTVYKANPASASANKQYLAIGIVASASNINASDSVTVITHGLYTTLPSDPVFTGADIGKAVFLSSTGELTLTAPTTIGFAQYQIGIVASTTTVWVDIKQLNAVVSEPAYSQRIQYPSGLAANTNITLPVNSINSLAQSYVFAERRLRVYLNQQLKYPSVDWIAGTSATTQIQFNYALPNDSEVHFVLDPIGSGTLTGGGGGGGSQTLQDTYNLGNTITTTSGVPLTVNGPISQTISVFNGDIEITGVIL
jgi:hypothetical protein